MTDWTTISDMEVVGALMQDVLDRIVAVYEAENVDLPERRYLMVGTSAHDCEQVTVSFQQMFAGTPGSRATDAVPCNSPRSVVLTIEVVRTVAVSTGQGRTPPTADLITENTLSKTADAWLLMDAAMTAREDYLGGVLADVSVQRESGGMQAVILNLTAGIP